MTFLKKKRNSCVGQVLWYVLLRLEPDLRLYSPIEKKHHYKSTFWNQENWSNEFRKLVKKSLDLIFGLPIILPCAQKRAA
jgi:hypothetical protein